MDPRARPDAMYKRKILPLRRIEPRLHSKQPAVSTGLLRPFLQTRWTEDEPRINRLRMPSYFIIILGVRLSPLGTAATTGLLYQPQVIDDGDCGAIGGIKIGRGNRSTGGNLPQRHVVHHKSHVTRPGFQPRVAAVESQRQTAWAMAWPAYILLSTENREELMRPRIDFSDVKKTRNIMKTTSPLCRKRLSRSCCCENNACRAVAQQPTVSTSRPGYVYQQAIAYAMDSHVTLLLSSS
jgi:hypothetical protein